MLLQTMSKTHNSYIYDCSLVWRKCEDSGKRVKILLGLRKDSEKRENFNRKFVWDIYLSKTNGISLFKCFVIKDSLLLLAATAAAMTVEMIQMA